MKILLDSADLGEIEELHSIFSLDGVTTNPSIIARERTDFYRLLRDIRGLIGNDKMLHVQVLGETAEEMAEEGRDLRRRIDGELYIKIPTTREGIKAIRTLKGEGLKVTATAIFTPLQALVAAKAGADYVAPYVNRLANISTDGIKVVSEIVESFAMHGIASKVLAASFTNAAQVHQAYLAGTHSVTLNPGVLREIINHPLTDSSIGKFKRDWEQLYGAGKRTNHL